MKYKYLIILLFLLLTGCYNYRELNDLAICSAIGISKSNDNYIVYIQILDTNTEDKKEPVYNTIQVEGKTIQDALRNSIDITSKRLFINHMQVLLIDYNLANESIEEVIDFFYRDPEARKEFKVLIADDNIEKLLTNKTILEKINGKNIKEKIDKNSIFLNNINNLSFNELLITYLNPYKELLISSIKLDNNTIVFSNSYMFKDNKIIKSLSKEDTLYYNFITNKIDDTILTISNNNHISLEIINNKTNIYYKNNNIYINLNIKATINDINYPIDINNNIEYLESLISKELSTNIYNSIISNYPISDIYGFKDLIYKTNYKDINNNINFIINTNINIIHKGNGDKNI